MVVNERGTDVRNAPGNTHVSRILEVPIMKRIGSLLVVLTFVLALLPAAPALAEGSLEATTTHTQVDPPLFEADRYLLAWAGEITGEVNGYVEWWIDTWNWTAWPDILDPTIPPAPISHYTEIVKIYDAKGGTLILETLERGQTNVPDSTWWANGEVVYADPVLFPGWEGRGVQETGVFDMSMSPWTGKSTFKLTSEPIVTGLVLVDAATDLDVGPLIDGTVIDRGTTPQFNIRVETAPGTVGSVGFAVVDSNNQPVRFRLDGQPRENLAPYAAGGDWPVGNYLPMTLKPGTYTITATAFSGGGLRGAAGPSFPVTFTVADPFTVAYEGEVLAINDDPAAVAARCTSPSWAIVSFEGTGEHGLLGSFHGMAEHCSYVGPLPDGTIGPNGLYGEGLFTLTAANGDLLEGTYTSGVTTAPPPNVEFLDLWAFTGGTGRFAAATGSGAETGTVDFSQGFGPGAAFAVIMEGLIAY